MVLWQASSGPRSCGSLVRAQVALALTSVGVLVPAALS